MSRKGCPQDFSAEAELLGLLRSPFATQGRSYKGQCRPACRRKGRHKWHKFQAKKNPAEAGFFMKLQTNYLAWAST